MTLSRACPGCRRKNSVTIWLMVSVNLSKINFIDTRGSLPVVTVPGTALPLSEERDGRYDFTYSPKHIASCFECGWSGPMQTVAETEPST